MESSLSSHRLNPTAASEALSLASLLERGIDCTRQGSFIEGAVFFVLARERLAADQRQLAIVIDAFLQSHSCYWQAQQSLHVASKRFAEADSEQQTCLGAIEKLLPALSERVEQGTHSPLQSQLSQLATAQISPQQTRLHLLSTDHQRSDFSIVESQASEFFHDAGDPLPDLSITCFGHFEVRRAGKPIVLCSSRKGQTILRYLVTQPGRSASIDTLMGLLWPDDEAEVAQRKLHIAMSALRRSLSQGCTDEAEGAYISCKNRVYSLNMVVGVQIDVDIFLHYYQLGRQSSDERIPSYEKACCLYTGPFLLEDLYADWSFLQREQLTQVYRSMCRVLAHHYLQSKRYEDAARWAIAILKENHCDEAAHRQLMQVYAAQGYRSEAVQQYHQCERILHEELGVSPLPETTQLLQVLLTNEALPF